MFSQPWMHDADDVQSALEAWWGRCLVGPGGMMRTMFSRPWRHDADDVQSALEAWCGRCSVGPGCMMRTMFSQSWRHDADDVQSALEAWWGRCSVDPGGMMRTMFSRPWRHDEDDVQSTLEAWCGRCSVSPGCMIRTMFSQSWMHDADDVQSALDAWCGRCSVMMRTMFSRPWMHDADDVQSALDAWSGRCSVSPGCIMRPMFSRPSRTVRGVPGSLRPVPSVIVWPVLHREVPAWLLAVTDMCWIPPNTSGPSHKEHADYRPDLVPSPWRTCAGHGQHDPLGPGEASRLGRPSPDILLLRWPCCSTNHAGSGSGVWHLQLLGLSPLVTGGTARLLGHLGWAKWNSILGFT